MTISRMLKDSADLYRASISRGDAGGVIESMEVHTTGFPCRISSSPPSERIVADTQFAEASGVVYVTSVQDIARGDEIRKGGVTYEVLGVRDPSVDNHHREVIVRREQHGS